MKTISNYQDRYAVTKDGKIWSYYLQGFLKTFSCGGYLYVTLSKDNEAKTSTVHRLVAKTFIPNPKNKPQINHKNGIKSDNRVQNLEWVTNQENQIHAFKTGISRGRKGLDNKRSKLTEEKVRKIKYLYDNKIKTIKEISSCMKLSYPTIQRITSRRRYETIE